MKHENTQSDAGEARPAIGINAVSKVYSGRDGEVVALDEVSVKVRQNEFFTLLGPSGCGKTTLLRLIAGFEHPTAGEILLDGEDISLVPPNQRPVNTVFQNYALVPHMTVAGNIAFGLEMLGWSRTRVSEAVDRMLALVRMEELKNRRTGEISGGQQQRVALARALAPQPRVLLLDEPLSALDLKLRKEMQIELKRLQSDTGITFVFVTHDQEEALTMSDRIAVMNGGRILQVGSPREIYHHPQNRFVAGFIGDSNILAGRSAGSARVALKNGKTLPVSPRAGGLPEGELALMIRPEHAHLARPEGQAGALTGTVDNIVYFGTDTHYHLTLDTGEGFIVRRQNAARGDDGHAVGEQVAIDIEEEAVQVLHGT